MVRMLQAEGFLVQTIPVTSNEIQLRLAMRVVETLQNNPFYDVVVNTSRIASSF